MKFVKLTAIALMCSSLTACITFPTDDSNTVKVLWDDIQALQGCEHKGTVIGSQGHFYDYWLHADKDMVWGTLNEMRIKAAQLDADTIYLYKPLGFTGSVTMMANAYQCADKPAEPNHYLTEPLATIDKAIAPQPKTLSDTQ
ncbi:DUF4156 domain-containing protein [Shewanella schlegeliana]|uniref:DUF4156 domain-containing protein n=1 Tax=Shewanella schlegeliana TaxID=190308 RepID=A0ABS1T285_9GAMM|nr:DUF4156 domain-containing protein [Shewanella schlegeliana]MBL4913922.1 DUF4156 domain-containing protein [Shewanella schlegeliana]MCL1108694.1 DUF4156 domain-containing protein [Shewanella schlegeliana]GIU26449.1 hypothetical protein TUM4433_12360 [Shewanella schlegeliana]